MFKMGTHCESSMPPNKDSLTKHLNRANYQAAIYKRALEADPHVPTPHGRGWTVDGDQISIHWTDLPPAPDSVMEFVNCYCKKNKCSKGNCSCLEKGLPCTDYCQCVDCENVPHESDQGSDNVDNADESSDISDDES